MRNRLFVGCCLLSVALASAAQQEHMEVTLVDATPQGNPFEVRGQISLQEIVTGNQVQSSWSEKVLAKNISKNPILLYVVSLTLVGRHNRGTLRGPGDGPTYLLSDDRFFRKDVIKPGEMLVLRDTMDRGQAECCINPLEHGSDPKAEFRVRFVQFADGSSFGDSADAKNNLALRTMILSGLRKLIQSNLEHGQQGFLSEMQRQPPWSNTLPFADIWTSYKEKGIDAAIARAHQTLAVAENHAASVREFSR